MVRAGVTKEGHLCRNWGGLEQKEPAASRKGGQDRPKGLKTWRTWWLLETERSQCGRSFLGCEEGTGNGAGVVSRLWTPCGFVGLEPRFSNDNVF